ncbi:MAG: NUDIX hydrolase, partial [Halobacteria archaeon]|nr:NUDIX hydrolase [Halobacteria archaeon]
VEVYVMEVSKVVSHWQESFRDRRWFTHREAMRRIKGTDLQRIVRQLPDFV